jgi:hypothetical protein
VHNSREILTGTVRQRKCRCAQCIDSLSKAKGLYLGQEYWHASGEILRCAQKVLFPERSEGSLPRPENVRDNREILTGTARQRKCRCAQNAEAP